MIRINEAITAPVVRLIDPAGLIYHEVSIAFALSEAKERKLDLVEINPHSNPPTCKIMEASPWLDRIKAGNKSRVKYDRRWRLAARVIEAARVYRGDPHGPNDKLFDEALAAWDTFNAPEPPPAAAKVKAG